MAKGTITLSEVLREMDKGSPFDLRVVTCDVKRGTGGAIKAYTRVILASSAGLGKKEKREELSLKEKVKKSPNHYQNSTRNIYDPKRPARERIKKIHLRLIIEFNDMTVI